MNTALLIIDPQNDFASPEGTLYVPGATNDCARLGNFIKKNVSEISSIHVSLDCHPCYHIAHPYFWKDLSGNNPAPYTIITYEDMANKVYQPVDESLNKKVEEYLLALDNKGRYSLTIWPPHCLTATWGCCVEKQVYDAIHYWEIENLGKNTNFVRKASNPLTEHYSAIQAEVPDPNDISTRTNFTLIDMLKNVDNILIAGEALSHCVANTIRDLATYIPVSKITLLTDCTSNVTGFEKMGDEFINEFKSKGMNLTTSETYSFR